MLTPRKQLNNSVNTGQQLNQNQIREAGANAKHWLGVRMELSLGTGMMLRMGMELYKWRNCRSSGLTWVACMFHDRCNRNVIGLGKNRTVPVTFRPHEFDIEIVMGYSINCNSSSMQKACWTLHILVPCIAIPFDGWFLESLSKDKGRGSCV